MRRRWDCVAFLTLGIRLDTELKPQSIYTAIIKARIVEADEREGGIRKSLNFGHTYGHAIEAAGGMAQLLHGECVALGMLPMCAESVRMRLLRVLKLLGLPTEIRGDLEAMLENASHDKKCAGKDISVVWVETPGTCEIRKLPLETWKEQIRTSLSSL